MRVALPHDNFMEVTSRASGPSLEKPLSTRGPEVQSVGVPIQLERLPFHVHQTTPDPSQSFYFHFSLQGCNTLSFFTGLIRWT